MHPRGGHSSSKYGTRIPQEVLDAKHDSRYSAKPVISTPAYQSHHFGKSHFMSVRDVPSAVYLDGLSQISSSMSVAALLMEDNAALLEVQEEFAAKLLEDPNEEEPPQVSSTANVNSQRSVRDRDRLRDRERAESVREALEQLKGLRKGSDPDRLGDSNDGSGESNGDPQRKTLEELAARHQESICYRLLPWQCVFQRWVRFLTDELVRVRSGWNGTSLRGAYVPFVEVFLERSRAAFADTSVKAFSTPTSKDKPKRKRTPGRTSNESVGPVIPYGQKLPHVLRIASALYAFDNYLLPLFGPYAEVAREALHQLVLAIFSEPPPVMGRSEELGGSQGFLLHVAQLEEASVYVRPTYLQRTMEIRPLYLTLRESNRKQAIVMERQEMILHRTLLRMQKQTAKRLLGAWYLYTQRARKLRAKYKAVFLSLSDSATVAVSVRKWKSVAKSLLAKKRQGNDNRQDPTMTQQGKFIQSKLALTALIQQKQTKTMILEAGTTSNRQLMMKRNELEGRASAARERLNKISNLWLGVVEDLLPPPTGGLSSAISPVLDKGKVVCFDTEAELSRDLIHWIVELSKRDDELQGARLTNVILAANGGNPTLQSVLARTTMILPLLRAAITTVQPPTNWLSTAHRVDAVVGSSSPLLSPNRFVAFGDAEVELSLSIGPSLSPSHSTAYSPEESTEDADAVALVAELTSSKFSKEKHEAGPRVTTLAQKHAALSLAFKAHLQASSLEETSSGVETPNPEESEMLRRKSSLNKLKESLTRRSSLTGAQTGAGSGPLTLTAGLVPQPPGQGQPNPRDKKHSAAPAISRQGSVVNPSALEPDQPRPKQLESLLKLFGDVRDASGLCQTAVGIALRLLRGNTAAFKKLFPLTWPQYLARLGEDWRELMLSFLFLTQFGNNSGCFRLLPTGGEKGKGITREGSMAFSPIALRPLQKMGSKSLLRKQSSVGSEPSFETGSQMSGFWEDRLRKKRLSGDFVKAARANRVHENAVAKIADSVLSGGVVAQECARVYRLYTTASASVSNNTVITSEFLASKMRILFPDKTSWRQGTNHRVITSPKDMEEYIKSMSVALQIPLLNLCDKMVQVLDDTDLFFISIGSREVQQSFENHLTDLSVIFSLYSSGEVPDHYVTLESWLILVHPFLDNCFTKTLATETFHKVLQRTSVGTAFRAEGGDFLSAPGHNQNRLSSTQPAHKLSTASSASQGSTQGAGIIPGAASSTAKGLSMDAFCQALCVVVVCKIPNPFTPLEAKIPIFINTWLVPMAGTKVKGGALKGNRASVTASISRDTFEPFLPVAS